MYTYYSSTQTQTILYHEIYILIYLLINKQYFGASYNIYLYIYIKQILSKFTNCKLRQILHRGMPFSNIPQFLSQFEKKYALIRGFSVQQTINYKILYKYLKINLRHALAGVNKSAPRRRYFPTWYQPTFFKSQRLQF